MNEKKTKLLEPNEVAEILRLKNPETLALWRSTNRYPELKWIKVGRLVRYREEDVVAFINARTRCNTD